jgi:hypothetical protein
MAEENAFGRPTVVTPGQQLHAQNGNTITMIGDEVGRLPVAKFQQNHRYDQCQPKWWCDLMSRYLNKRHGTARLALFFVLPRMV